MSIDKNKIRNETIHALGLRLLGRDEALSKLLSELIELSHEISMMLENKGYVGNVVHEFRDVCFVWERVKLTEEFKVHLMDLGLQHTLQAEYKLQHAINCKIEENKQ